MRLGPEPEDLEFTNHVGARLPGNGTVAIHFARRDAVVDRLLARPVFRVQPRVHDEPARAKKLEVELAKLGLAEVPTGEFDVFNGTSQVRSPRGKIIRSHSPPSRPG